MKVTEGAVKVEVCVFSSGFDSPKEKPPLAGLLSVPDAAAPKTDPLVSPNLKPESDFLPTVDVELSVEPPNLNPDELEVSLGAVSVEELPNEAPNLKPLDDEEEDESARASPNLKPTEPEVESDDEPNLKPPELEVPIEEEPDPPKGEEPKALGSTLDPGLAVWQATHCTSAALF